MPQNSPFGFVAPSLGDEPNVPADILRTANGVAAKTGRPTFTDNGARDLAYKNSNITLTEGMRCVSGVQIQTYKNGAWVAELWNSAVKAVALPPGDITVRNYTYYSDSPATFQLGGGWCLITARVDAELKACGAFYARLSGDEASEDFEFDDYAPSRRRRLILTTLKYCNPGSYSPSIDVKCFAGAVRVNSIRYSIQSLGTVS